MTVERPLPDLPQRCPACATRVCAYCRTAWHPGATCASQQVGVGGS